MVKTRSQYLKLQVKKEEHKDKTKLHEMLRGTQDTIKRKSKITKNKKTRSATVKSESTGDKKPFSSLPAKSSKQTVAKNEQIAKLIDYIANCGMSIKEASIKVRMPCSAAYYYYQRYQNDPEHKIPLAKTSSSNRLSKLTQEKIEEVIKYIVHEKMNMTNAANKANVCIQTANKYYTKYLEDPEHKIPTPFNPVGHLNKHCTQEQINKLIGYIIHDNMNIMAASAKANMDKETAKRYYLKFLEDPSHGVPVAGKANVSNNKRCTDEQVRKLISYIVDDGMSVSVASVKANMSRRIAGKYYQQYLEDPDHKIPTPQAKGVVTPDDRFNLERAKKFFSYVIIDKLNVRQASLKVGISETTGYKNYRMFLENPIEKICVEDTSYSVEKMKRLVEYIQVDKMTVRTAATKAKMNYDIARKRYKEYSEDPNHIISKEKDHHHTPEDVQTLIDYIENDNMSINSAAAKVQMTTGIACKFYRAYKKRQKRFDQYLKIVTDIYKNNPSIKPIHDSYQSNPELLATNIKQEHCEIKEDLKRLA